MAIYTRCGAPCEIVAVRTFPVWRVRRANGNIDILRIAPARLGKRDTVMEFDVEEVRIRRTGPYPDGSGGAQAEPDEEWYESSFLVADEGWREIGPVVDALKAQAGGRAA